MQSKIHIGQGSIEMGVFASVPIREGEVIFFVTGKLLTFKEVMALPGEGDRTIQIGADLYVNPGYPAEFINHSCEPNAGIRDDLAMVALEAIEVGKEIRFDYSTCIQEGEFRMECRCRAPSCRKWIGDFSDLPDELKARYIRLGVVQPFILDQHFHVRRRSTLEAAFSRECGVAPVRSGNEKLSAQASPGQAKLPQPLAGLI
jgi:hypothetical protein